MTGPVAPHSPNSCTRTPPGTATLRTRPSTPSPVRYFCPPPPRRSGSQNQGRLVRVSFVRVKLSDSALSESALSESVCPSQFVQVSFVRVSLSESVCPSQLCPSPPHGQARRGRWPAMPPGLRPAGSAGRRLRSRPPGRERRDGSCHSIRRYAACQPRVGACVCARDLFVRVRAFVCARATKGHSSESVSSSSMRSPPQSRSS